MEQKLVEMQVRLNRLIYEKDNFIIASFEVVKNKDENNSTTKNITAKGTCFKPDYGVAYKLVAKETQDPKYGKQYNIISLNSSFKLNSEDEKRKFFSFFLSKTQIESLLNCGQDPIQMLENRDIASLCKIKGIKEFTAKRMCDGYDKNKDNSSVYVKLYEFGLTKNAIDKLVGKYGSPQLVINKITENPYVLISEVEGYGWAKADAMALNAGIAPTSTFRLNAFVEFYLTKVANEDGNTWVSLQEIRNAFYEYIPEATDEDVRKTLKGLNLPNALGYSIIKYFPETDRICLTRYLKLEQDIAKELKRIMKGANLPYDKDKIEEVQKETEKVQGWTFEEEQVNATKLILNNPVSIITGYAGSGKSSSLTLATSILNKHHSYSIAQTALSGRAASRMSEITGLPGYTIHRLLGINFETGVPAFSEKIPLNKNIIILDETSMVDGYIFLKLLKAIKTGSKLVMLGDTHQLECIGLCNLLNDMIQSHVIPHLDLKKIHRQAAKSGIISTAAKISNGQQIIPSIIWQGAQTCGELQDLDIIGLEGNALSQETILDEYRKLIGKGINKDDIDVIVPMRKRGDICLNVLNQKIQDIVTNKSLNYVTCRRKTKEDNEVDIYEGDRIIVTQNNYHDVMDENEHEVPIFNGNIGKVINISPNGKEMTVDLYQQGKVIIPSSVFSCIDLGYAITCHAKQGSETPYAIIGLDSSCYTLLSREWLYTALTRAKKHCILIGQNTMLFKAVKISSISKKQTWLTELLQKN